LAFDKNAKLLIYDSSSHYLSSRNSGKYTLMTALFSMSAFHQLQLVSSEAFNKYFFGSSLTGSMLGVFQHLSQKLERKRAIA